MTLRQLFRFVRISLLLVVLVIIGFGTWLTKLRTTDWEEPLWLVVYPINGDQSKASERYINNLKVKHFQSIDTFLKQEAEYFKVPIQQPITIKLGPQIHSLPPTPPENKNIIMTMWWSLELRYWAYQNDTFSGPRPDIRIFLVYYDSNTHHKLRHSLGLEKGLIGVVNAFASRRYTARNNVVIAHELLHTLGATDKYDYASGQPIYPDGYSEPDNKPLYPQLSAEIMGGRIPLSKAESKMPSSLSRVVIGSKTAQEIRWLSE